MHASNIHDDNVKSHEVIDGHKCDIAIYMGDESKSIKDCVFCFETEKSHIYFIFCISKIAKILVHNCGETFVNDINTGSCITIHSNCESVELQMCERPFSAIVLKARRCVSSEMYNFGIVPIVSG
jgi:hypothetical protein